MCSCEEHGFNFQLCCFGQVIKTFCALVSLSVGWAYVGMFDENQGCQQAGNK